MPKHQLSSEAKADLSEIFDYIAADNVFAADKLIDRFLETFRKLAQYPNLGRERPELAEHLRSFPVGSYVIFYRPWAGSVVIVRVLHGARDLDENFD